MHQIASEDTVLLAHGTATVEALKAESAFKSGENPIVPSDSAGTLCRVSSELVLDSLNVFQRLCDLCRQAVHGKCSREMKTLAGHGTTYSAPKSDFVISSLNPFYRRRFMACKTTVQIHFTALKAASELVLCRLSSTTYIIEILTNRN